MHENMDYKVSQTLTEDEARRGMDNSFIITEGISALALSAGELTEQSDSSLVWETSDAISGEPIQQTPNVQHDQSPGQPGTPELGTLTRRNSSSAASVEIIMGNESVILPTKASTVTANNSQPSSSDTTSASNSIRPEDSVSNACSTKPSEALGTDAKPSEAPSSSSSPRPTSQESKPQSFGK
jgi:hypothetical protein